MSLPHMLPQAASMPPRHPHVLQLPSGPQHHHHASFTAGVLQGSHKQTPHGSNLAVSNAQVVDLTLSSSDEESDVAVISSSDFNQRKRKRAVDSCTTATAEAEADDEDQHDDNDIDGTDEFPADFGLSDLDEMSSASGCGKRRRSQSLQDADPFSGNRHTSMHDRSLDIRRFMASQVTVRCGDCDSRLFESKTSLMECVLDDLSQPTKVCSACDEPRCVGCGKDLQHIHGEHVCEKARILAIWLVLYHLDKTNVMAKVRALPPRKAASRKQEGPPLGKPRINSCLASGVGYGGAESYDAEGEYFDDSEDDDDDEDEIDGDESEDTEADAEYQQAVIESLNSHQKEIEKQDELHNALEHSKAPYKATCPCQNLPKPTPNTHTATTSPTTKAKKPPTTPYDLTKPYVPSPLRSNSSQADDKQVITYPPTLYQSIQAIKVPNEPNPSIGQYASEASNTAQAKIAHLQSLKYWHTQSEASRAQSQTAQQPAFQHTSSPSSNLQQAMPATTQFASHIQFPHPSWESWQGTSAFSVPFDKFATNTQQHQADAYSMHGPPLPYQQTPTTWSSQLPHPLEHSAPHSWGLNANPSTMTSPPGMFHSHEPVHTTYSAPQGQFHNFLETWPPGDESAQRTATTNSTAFGMGKPEWHSKSHLWKPSTTQANSFSPPRLYSMGHYTSHSPTNPPPSASMPPMPPLKKKHSQKANGKRKEEQKPPQPTPPSPTEVRLEQLGKILPCTERESAFDITPPSIVLSMIICSRLLEVLSELLRNDSLTHICKHSSLYHAAWNVLQIMATHYTLVAAVQMPQPEKPQDVGLERLSYLPWIEPGLGQKAPLAKCLNGAFTQSKSVLRRSKRSTKEFESEDGQMLVFVCQRLAELEQLIEDTTPVVTYESARIQAATSQERPTPKPAEEPTTAVKDDAAWHRSICVSEVEDETMFGYHVFTSDAKKMAQSPKGRMRHLVEEIVNLETSLPPGIFVRYASSRMDVIKALIIGPSDTPYEGGLFEFDILCPIEYPNVAPKVKFKTTGGGRAHFNPNLYNNGKVCLSLLGTWSGTPWKAGESTLLQVLVSIQSMILCEYPWYNEPGRESSYGLKDYRTYGPAVKYNKEIQDLTTKHAIIGWINDCENNVWPDLVKHYFRTSKGFKSVLGLVSKWAAENKRINDSLTALNQLSPDGPGPKPSAASAADKDSTSGTKPTFPAISKYIPSWTPPAFNKGSNLVTKPTLLAPSKYIPSWMPHGSNLNMAGSVYQGGSAIPPPLPQSSIFGDPPPLPPNIPTHPPGTQPPYFPP